MVALYNGAATSWSVKTQTGVSRSTAEAELAALDLGTREALWYRKLGMSLQMDGAETIEIFEDNSACLAIANGSKWSARTKHVDVKHFAVRDDVAQGRVKVSDIASEENPADCLTKPLGVLKFEKFRTMMGVVPCRLSGRTG